jgi:hypothetical protein
MESIGNLTDRDKFECEIDENEYAQTNNNEL